MKKIITWMIAPALLLVLVLPQGAYAATPVYYNPNQAQINYLYSLILQLQAQLNALQGSGGSTGSTGPSGTVTSTDYLSVRTDGVTAYNRENIELEGQVNFKRSGDARVWFEYSQDKALNYSSVSQTLKNRSNSSNVNFAISIPDLQTNRVYYYRAVAEGKDGRYAEGALKSFRYEGSSGNYNNNNSSNNNDDTPDVTTDSADNVSYNRATLRGEVDMNDFKRGLAFFVYGEDEDRIEDVEDEDTYRDIYTQTLYLQKTQVASNLNGNRTFGITVTGLNQNTDHYYRLCVQYEDEDGDDTLACGDVESFETSL